MKEIKSLLDAPEFVAVSDAVRQCELELVSLADRAATVELEILNFKTSQRKEDDEWSQFMAGAGTPLGETQLKGLREEEKWLEQRRQFLTQALEQGKMELDCIRRKLSLEICKLHRPAFAEDAKKILSHLQAICELDQQSRHRRTDLERDGVVTGALPYNLFDIGQWDDQCGGRIQGYRRWLGENYEISS
jgi:hypothetical protein